MTVGELHASIKLRIDRVGSYSTSGLEPGEVDDYINEAIRDYVNEQRRFLREYKNVDRGAEAQENLRPLINREEITTINSNTIIDEDGFEVDLSNLTNYDYFVSGKADFNGEWNILKTVSSGYLTDENENQYNSPFLNGIPVAVEDAKLVGVHPNSDTTPSKLIINYVQTPEYVDLNGNQNTNLPEHTHRDIMNMTVAKIISSLSSSNPEEGEQS